MIVSLISCIIGATMVLGFLGFMLVWVPAPPLIIIVAFVMALMLYDFYFTLRYGERGSRGNGG